MLWRRAHAWPEARPASSRGAGGSGFLFRLGRFHFGLSLRALLFVAGAFSGACLAGISLRGFCSALAGLGAGSLFSALLTAGFSSSSSSLVFFFVFLFFAEVFFEFVPLGSFRSRTSSSSSPPLPMSSRSSSSSALFGLPLRRRTTSL